MGANTLLTIIRLNGLMKRLQQHFFHSLCKIVVKERINSKTKLLIIIKVNDINK